MALGAGCAVPPAPPVRLFPPLRAALAGTTTRLPLPGYNVSPASLWRAEYWGPFSRSELLFHISLYLGVTARINTADTDRPGVYRFSRAEDPNLASGRLGYRWITVVLNRRADPLRRPAAGRARRAAHTGKERHRRQTPITNHLNNRTICGPRVAGCVESSRQCECHPLTAAAPG